MLQTWYLVELLLSLAASWRADLVPLPHRLAFLGVTRLELQTSMFNILWRFLHLSIERFRPFKEVDRDPKCTFCNVEALPVVLEVCARS